MEDQEASIYDVHAEGERGRGGDAIKSLKFADKQCIDFVNRGENV